MSIAGIGSIESFVKQLGLKANVEAEAKTGLLASGTVKNAAADVAEIAVKPGEAAADGAPAEQEDRPMSETERALKLLEEDEDKRLLRSIRFKMFSGSRLSASERAHLRDNDPAAYAQLRAAENERKLYERRLKRCKTREEVRALNMSTLGSCASAAKSAAHGSAGDALGVKMRCDAVQNSTLKFMRSGGLSALPTQAETAKANREMRDAMLGLKRTLGESNEVRKVKRARMRAAYAAVTPSHDAEDCPESVTVDIDI